MFTGHWCSKCTKDNAENGGYCPILNGSLSNVKQQEWRYVSNAPVCTAFEPKGISHITPGEVESVKREAYTQKPSVAPRIYTPAASVSDYGSKALKVPVTKAVWSSAISVHREVKYWIETQDYKDYWYVIMRGEKQIKSREPFPESVLAGAEARKAIDRVSILSRDSRQD